MFFFFFLPLQLIPGDSRCFTVCLLSCSRAHAACVTVTLISGSTVRGFGTKPLQAHACMWMCTHGDLQINPRGKYMHMYASAKRHTIQTREWRCVCACVCVSACGASALLLVAVMDAADNGLGFLQHARKSNYSQELDSHRLHIHKYIIV